MWSQLNKRILFGAFFALVMIYGFLAMDISRVLFTALMDGGHRSEMIAEFDGRGEPGAGEFNRWERARDGSLWMAVFGTATDLDHGYGFESAYGVLVDYFRLPRLNHAFLSVHTGTGGLALVIMMFLLVPSLRRGSFRYHKPLGRSAASILSVSMFCAIAYLWTTPEDKVFADLAFYVGLWILAVITTTSLAISIYSIKRGHRARHQAFMHLAFAAMLTAPLLRLDWMIIWAFSPDATFVENHYLAEIILLPQCLVVGYLFFAWARKFNPLHDRPEKIANFDGLRGAAGMVVIGFAVVTALNAILYLDLELLSYAGLHVLVQPEYYPAKVQANGTRLFDAHLLPFVLQKVLMVSAALLATGLAAWHLLRGKSVRELPAAAPRVLAVLVLSAGVLGICIGAGLGTPSHEVRSAGAYLIIYGLLAIVLFTLLLFSRRSATNELFRDSYWLMIGLAVTPAQFAQSWFTMNMTRLPPLDVYSLAAGNAVLGLLPALVWIMWTQHPGQRRVF